MKAFKNIQSKLYVQTKEWVANEQEMNNNRKPKSQLQKAKPNINNKQKPQYINTHPNVPTQQANKDNQSLFEKYYQEKLLAKGLNSNNINHTEGNGYNEENIYNNLYQQQQPLNNNINNNNNTYQDNIEQNALLNQRELTEQEIKDIALQQLLEDYHNGKFKIEDPNAAIENINNSNSNNNNRQQLKEPTPTIKDAPLILPKIQKNYLLENKKLITEHKIQQKHKPKAEQSQTKHKDYGKTPEYLEKYKKEAEIKKELIRKYKEEQKYPKGTKLLTEEERLTTLNGLINTKKDIQNQIEKMPITTRTKAVQYKKEELEHKMDEIDRAIEMFSKKQVFVKME